MKYTPRIEPRHIDGDPSSDRRFTAWSISARIGDVVACRIDGYSYRAAGDRRPGATFEESTLGNLAIAGLFDPIAARESGAGLSLDELGYTKPPAAVHVFERARTTAGYADLGLVGSLMAWACRHLGKPGDLMATEFAGAEYQSNGRPSPRGYAAQLDFLPINAQTQALPADVLASLRDGSRGPLTFTRRAEKTTTA
jgi:hypothetical protein